MSSAGIGRTNGPESAQMKRNPFFVYAFRVKANARYSNRFDLNSDWMHRTGQKTIEFGRQEHTLSQVPETKRFVVAAISAIDPFT
jgi:hypothetical protein